MADTIKHGWDKFDEKATVPTPKHERAKKFGIGKSYTVCFLGAAIWAFIQFAILLMISFGLADNDFWWLTAVSNSLKFASVLVFAFGLFLLWVNASPSRKQVSCNIIAVTAFVTVVCSFLRLFLKRASYGGLNTAGMAVIFIMIGLMLLNYRKKPPLVEKLWSFSGVTATSCFVTSSLMFIMLFSMQLLPFSFFQKVFLISFYGSEGFELITLVMLAVYYTSRKRLVRSKPAN